MLFPAAQMPVESFLIAEWQKIDAGMMTSTIPAHVKLQTTLADVNILDTSPK
jgi:hypothetical protein